MRTIIITHTDWDGPSPRWVRQPYLAGGTLQFRRDNRADWDHVWHALGSVAQVNCVAIGCRGTFDPPAVACLPMARAAYDAAAMKPTVTFWADTVGLPDITHNLDGRPFDFTNVKHLAWAWEHFVRHFFQHFKTATLERAPSGKVLIPWWGISSATGHGFRNQSSAQLLLDYIDQQVAALGLVGADHIVDRNWLEQAPNLRVFGVHAWFNPWPGAGGAHVPESYSIHEHHGITTGMVVPGFSDPNVPLPELIPASGARARSGLAACLASGCDYALLEGATDFVEGAEWLPSSNGDTSKLEAIRDFSEPIDEEGEPPVVAITSEPLKDFVLFDALLPGSGQNTFALPWREVKDKDGKVIGGEPDPTSDRVFSLQKNGTVATRRNVLGAEDGIREWESGKVVDNKLLVFVTEGVAMKVFGLIRVA